ncbi:MAG: nucleoside kinase [Bellilinea sp.]|jgi:uridine kinase
MDNTNNPAIQAVQPREDVEIHLPDGRVFRGRRHTTLVEFFNAMPEWDRPLVVGAIVNHELRELTFPITIDSKVEPVTMASPDGARIYRRSITFLLEAAFEDLFPDGSLTVDHSVSSGGYYCQVGGREPLSHADLKRLEEHMRALVAKNLPFQRKTLPLADAIQFFAAKGYSDKARLLKYRNKEHLVLYQLGEHRDYHHGYMVPSTGYLRWFGLKRLNEGFILRFPRRHAPDQLLPMPDYPMLLRTFKQYGAWLSNLGIESVGALNDGISENRIREIILVSEALHEQKIAEIARQIIKKAKTARVILIAGPSSSGKTTFSKRLSVQLLTYGLSPFAIEMDNYFVNREQTPRDEFGNYDFESLEALNAHQLDQDLRRVIEGLEVQLPRFDFRAGKSSPGEIVQLLPDQMIILEGIHGLNPRLLPNIPAEQTFRIYVSCLTQLNLDRYNRISTTDTRLLRRIVRDARERGYSALETIGRWESVRRGEKRHIFPYQENADEIFNSALVYELSAMKPLVEPLLRQVPFGSAEYIEAKRLLAFLEWFSPIDLDLIPDNSILREFIGGSILKDFKIWKNCH